MNPAGSIRILSGVCLCLSSIFLFAPGACRAEEGAIFSFSVVETREISGRFTVAPGAEIAVDWGDGTRETFGEGGHRYSVDYGSDTDTEVRFYADSEAAITEFRMLESGADISFDIKDIPRGMNTIIVEGDNSVTGELRDIPVSIESIRIAGRNTISGDVSEIHEALNSLDIVGRNTVTGDVAELPREMRSFRVLGGNTVGGDAAGLPRGLTYLRMDGNNQLSGDIKDLPRNLTYCEVRGDNTLTGDIKDAPPVVRSRFTVEGNNTLSGNIKDLPGRLVRVDLQGENTITGNIAHLPANMGYIIIAGANTISDYTAGRNWTEGMRILSIEPAAGHGLGTGEVDALLKDLSRTTWRGEKRLWLAGNHAAHSAASKEALAVLEEQGVRVEVNAPPPPLPGDEGGEAARTLEEMGITITVPGE